MFVLSFCSGLSMCPTCGGPREFHHGQLHNLYDPAASFKPLQALLISQLSLGVKIEGKTWSCQKMKLISLLCTTGRSGLLKRMVA
jgi:hypothetical protein